MTNYEEFIQTLDAQHWVSAADHITVSEIQFNKNIHTNNRGIYSTLTSALRKAGYSPFMISEYCRLSNNV